MYTKYNSRYFDINFKWVYSISKMFHWKGEVLVTKENNQQDNQQNKDNKRIEKRSSRGSFEKLLEHDNTSIISIMNQIESNKKKEKW